MEQYPEERNNTLTGGPTPSFGLSIKGVITILYSEIKRMVLSLIGQYTMAGNVVADSYNNQADYLNKIPGLINAALMNLRTYAKPSTTLKVLSDGEEYSGMLRYEMPEDFRKLKTGGVYILRHGQLSKTNDYRLMGGKTILLPKQENTEYAVEYYCYPSQLPLTCNDSYDLREEPDVIQAAIYYAAAMLMMQEDEFTYATLFNEYESRLQRMSYTPEIEVQTTDDVYGFDICGEEGIR